MPSTLTSGVKDGKQSKKIERNTRERLFIEILLLVMLTIFELFAQGLNDAQSILAGVVCAGVDHGLRFSQETQERIQHCLADREVHGIEDLEVE
jgi:hypothetical protein